MEKCQAVVSRLHKMCCEPNRSPRMQAIEESLVRTRPRLSAGITDETGGDLLGSLKAIGSQLGGLQVECCAPARMPLYAEALERLTATQWSINSGSVRLTRARRLQARG